MEKSCWISNLFVMINRIMNERYYFSRLYSLKLAGVNQINPSSEISLYKPDTALCKVQHLQHLHNYIESVYTHTYIYTASHRPTRTSISIKTPRNIQETNFPSIPPLTRSATTASRNGSVLTRPYLIYMGYTKSTYSMPVILCPDIFNPYGIRDMGFDV